MAGALLPSVSFSSTKILRSSLIKPCLFRSDQPTTGGNSRSRRGGRCVAQISVPKIAELLQSGLSPEAQESIVRSYHGILHNAVELGVPIPADENALAHWAIAIPAGILYALATPGPVAGLAGFVQGHFSANSCNTFSAEDVELGRQLGEGSFGVVHEGFIGKGKKKQGKTGLHVVLKKTKARVAGAHEMRNAEIHMNQRLQKTAPGTCAEFLGTVNVTGSQARGKLTEGVWLVWNYQGDRTLDYYMKQKYFPQNIAEVVLGKKVKKSASKEALSQQNALVVRKVMQQILVNLHDLHQTGVVHRDLKPLNLVLTEDTGSFKLIDLGACVDIRSGFNYSPEETVIDPTFAAPEHYVMPTSTPALPPDPFCSLVSPVVWLLNTPDRFDIYSAIDEPWACSMGSPHKNVAYKMAIFCVVILGLAVQGLILMQLSIKQLRQDVGLQTFNTHLKRAGYDLNLWRKRCNISSEEFAILDADGGAGWELATAMLQPRHDKSSFIWPSLGSSRPSAAAALNHRFIQTTQFPRSINFPSVMPDFSSLSFPSPSPLQLPLFSGSALKTAISQVGNIQEAVANIDQERISTSVSAAAPTAATGAFAIGAGWMILTALTRSAQATYGMGQWMGESLGLSGTAFLAFILLIKPWLEEQDAASLRERDTQARIKADQLALLGPGTQVSSVDNRIQEILETKSRQSGTMRLRTGLAESVLAMEAQLASLESSILKEQEFAVQQQELLSRMKKLLITPPVEMVYATSTDEGEELKSSNGAYLGRPFTEYIN